MNLSPDFVDLLRALNDEKARYLIVGAHAAAYITGISGVTFDEAWPRRSEDNLNGLEFFVIGREDLIKNKKAAGRLKDLADVERLERDR